MLLKNVYLDNEIKDILIKDNLIYKIDNSINSTNTKVIDCRGKAILPSFCNTHTHAAMMFLRGIGEDKELFDWLNNYIWPREAKLKQEMFYSISRFAILEMIKTGTTFFSDMYFQAGETIRAVQDMGIRGAISYCGMDLFDRQKTEQQIENFQTFLNEPSPSPRIIKGLSCHAIYTTSEELMKKAKEISRMHHTYLHIHASETQKEVDDCLKKYNCRPIELLHKWNILDENTILAHCVHLSDEEIKILAETHTTVAHCPASNFKLNSGQLEWHKYKDVRLTIGTDGVASNNSLAMQKEMRTAAFSAKNKAHNVSVAQVDEVYNAATRNGFEFFGLKAGEIKEGFLADFILVDLDNYLLLPNHNLKSNMIYAADSSCITDVFCNGVQVMTDRKVPHEKEIIEEFKMVADLFK